MSLSEGLEVVCLHSQYLSVQNIDALDMDICNFYLLYLPKYVIFACTSLYHEFKECLPIFVIYTEKIIYNIFAFWNWNIELISLLVYLLFIQR